MTTLPISPPTIVHTPRCGRPAPVLQLSQMRTPMLICPGCLRPSDLIEALRRWAR